MNGTTTRLLFVTPTAIDHPRGGRSMLARLHRDQLRRLLGEGQRDHVLREKSGRLRSLGGYIDGTTLTGIRAVLDAVDAHRADTVWLDGSNLGRLAAALKRERPAVRVVTFCHNVEARFFLGSLRHAPGVRALGVLIGNAVAERLATRHSDDLVALSERDSALLKRLYGRGASAILPMALADQAPGVDDPTARVTADAPLLFVGGAFYANQAGIAWYADSVAPRAPSITTQVIGQGMEAMAPALRAARGIDLIGAVDQLHRYYRDARAVVAPIFDGSGMKTKVAEALMYGKHVIGTPEAFSGYARDVIAANRCCVDPDTFLAAVEALVASPLPLRADPAMRALYERDHSPGALRARMAAILGVETREAAAPRGTAGAAPRDGAQLARSTSA